MTMMNTGGSFTITFNPPDELVWLDGGGNVIYTLKATSAGIRLGSGSNYTEFESDGSQEMVGNATVFVDELGDLSEIQILGTGIAKDTAEVSVGFQTGCAPASDYAYKNVQLNHFRKHGAVVNPHIHWVQAENTGVNWLLQYRWQKNGGAKTTAWTNYPMTTLVFTYTSGSLNQISHGAGITPPAGDGISDIIQVRITRDKTNSTGAFAGSDTYTATAQATSFDIHVEMDTLGSRSQYSK